VYRKSFLSNPRLGMLIRAFDKMSDEKGIIFKTANKFMKQLDQEVI